MVAARWVVKGMTTQHRDPGCRGLDRPCAKASRMDKQDGIRRDILNGAIARGFVDERRLEDVAALRQCMYCFSAAGYERLPVDFPYMEQAA